jgi:hypothetical protein
MTTLPARFIPADLLTSHHYVFGQLKVAQSGLMGMFSDVTSSYLEVDDASLAHVYKPDKVLNYTPVMWMVKAQVVLVCPASVSTSAHKASCAAATALFPYPVQITTSIFDITGTLEWSGRFEFSALMSEGTNAFFMLYDVVVTSTLFPSLHLEAPAALMNRSFLETLVVVKRSAPEG